MGRHGGLGALGTDRVLGGDTSVLSEDGHEVTLIYGERDGDFAPVDPIRERLLPDLRPLSELRRLIRQLAPDVAHLHLIPPYARPDLIEQVTAACPTVMTVHHHFLTCPTSRRLFHSTLRPCDKPAGATCLIGLFLHHCGERSHPIRFVQSYAKYLALVAAAKKVACLIATSQYLAKGLVRAGFDSRRVRVVPPASPYVEEQDSSPFDSSSNMLLYVGRLHEEKGVELLLRASGFLGMTHRVVIAGDGPALPALRAAARSFEVSDRVDFLGAVPHVDLPALYRRAAVVVVPSVWPEPFGLIGFEAMAHARPVVAFAVGGIPTWLLDGQNGLLAKAADPRDLAAKIRRLLDDKALAAAMGKRGQALLSTVFGRQRYRDSLLNVYEQARDDFVRRSRDGSAVLPGGIISPRLSS